MLTLYQIGHKKYQYVQSYNHPTRSYTTVSSFNNDLFRYFEWRQNPEIKNTPRNTNGQCISHQKSIKEKNRSILWKFHIFTIILQTLDDSILFKYLPFYIYTRHQYEDYIYDDTYKGDILECIGYVLLNKERSVRIINNETKNDTYIYYSEIDNNIKIQTIPTQTFENNINYYDNLFDEIKNNQNTLNSQNIENPPQINNRNNEENVIPPNENNEENVIPPNENIEEY